MAGGKQYLRRCEVCGRTFMARGSSAKYCYECKKTVYKSTDRDDSDAGIRARAEKRAKHNESIVGEGYAERQIVATLKLAGKIDVNMERGDRENE